MAAAPLVPCREWLGLEPADLATPHRVLGVDAAQTDPREIVRAADRRLAILRAVPADRAVDRDSLVARVEAARDAMLAAAVAARSAVPVPPPVPPRHAPWTSSSGVPGPPPVPPAVTAHGVPAPPPVPPPGVGAADSSTAEPVRIDPRRVVRRTRSDGAATALATSAVVLAVAAGAAYVAWPHVRRSLPFARASAPQASPQQPHAQQPSPTGSEARQHPESVPPQPQPAPRAEAPRPVVPDPPRAVGRSAPVVPGPAQPPPIDVGQVRSRVDAAVARALAALGDRDVSAAQRELDTAVEPALDDQQATDRLRRWRQLLVYAASYPECRDQALASAAQTATTFDVAGRHIAVVEVTAREFAYRDSRQPGRTLRVPRGAIPADVEHALVEAWFAADGRAANHMILGAAALCGPEPDLRTARREWQAAVAGGDRGGALLLEILDDPALRGR